ncbi:MAG: cupin domain-containing protein [Deltaproteobacteria bacterium]|nr:cupin domain-containing protein [Deltaproteobacteria bacterium]
MRAFFWIEDDAGPREGEAIDGETLRAEGIPHARIETVGWEAPIDALMRERGYRTRDEVRLSPSTENLDTILAKFDREHLHTDDEVRYVLAGEGIFDIRSSGDRWMRVVVEPGDFIVVPKDRHHRFLLTESRTIHAVRLFEDQAGWVPHYR